MEILLYLFIYIYNIFNCRAMAAMVSSKQTVESMAPMGVGPRTLSNAVEGFLEVLTRVLFNQPGALPLLLRSDVEAEGRFLDRWLSISSRKYEP